MMRARYQAPRSILSSTLGVGMVLVLSAHSAFAGFTQTLPKNTFVLEEAYIYSQIGSIWNNSGKEAAILEDIERFEPGQGQQGVIKPQPVAAYTVLISQLQYGITDNLTLGVGLPVILGNTVDPKLGWEEGDYQNKLGRSYTDEDFWIWAETLGQEKPRSWSGNNGTLSDTVLGLRWRYSDGIDWFSDHGLAASVSLMGLLPTGKNATPEEAVSLGTTMWDLHTMGDVGIHLGLDKKFYDGDITLGIDAFYEHFFTRTLDTPKGIDEPLLLTFAPYVGDTYQVKPGDFSGAAIQIDVVAYEGEARQTWLTEKDPSLANRLPPMVSFYLQYRYVHLQQTDWKSNFPLWDWEREKYWRPGYKNYLTGRVTVSWLRLGVPLMTYLNVQSLTLIPGRNSRAADGIGVGVQALLKFW